MEQVLVQLLSSYSGRDKVMRTSSYVAMLLAGATKGTTAEKFATVAKQLSGARVVLRLFDDLPMWVGVTNKYGLGKHEPNALIRKCSILSNLASQLFFPVEHIAWLAENRIISIKSDVWWTRGIKLWAISLAFNIIKGIKSLQVIRVQRALLIKQRRLESPEKSTASAAEYRKSMRQLDDKEILEVLALIKNSLDLLNAVNWLPKGFLWAGKFPTLFCGLVGTLSSLAGIVAMLITA